LKRVIYLTILILSVSLFRLNASELEFIKTIGDERDDYTFFIITGADFAKNKDIFVLDGQGLFISKFNWEGKFLKKTGQKGQGPNDFYFPRTLHIFQEKVYILDSGNHRIAESDLELTKFNYYKFPEDRRFDSSFFTLPNGRFIGPFHYSRPNRNRIGVLDKKGNLLYHFFNELPSELGVNMEKIANSKNREMQIQHLIVSKESEPYIAVDHARETMLLTFKKPGNPVDFYVYSIKGELQKKFSYPLPAKYKFFDYYIKTQSIADLRNPNHYPKESHYPFLMGLQIYKGHYIALLWFRDYKKKELVNETYSMLIFNPNGTLKDELKFEDPLKILSISEEGIVLAGKSDEEITKLYIYQLKL
jgi:6-bladed beta-propeller